MTFPDRNRQREAQSFRTPVEFCTTRQLALHAGAGHLGSVTLGLRGLDRRPARLDPLQLEITRVHLPCQSDTTRDRRQRTVFGSIGRQLVYSEGNNLRGRWWKKYCRAIGNDPP